MFLCNCDKKQVGNMTDLYIFHDKNFNSVYTLFLTLLGPRFRVM